MQIHGTWWHWGAEFGENEETAQFRFRFLLAVLANGVFITGLFAGADAVGAVQLSVAHRWVVRAFVLVSVATLAALHGHKERLHGLCWVHWATSLAINLSGLLTVPQDELRVLWFFMHLAGSFILLGVRVGVASGVLLLALAWLANPASSHPYSPAALVTLTVALVGTTLMFWAYTLHMQQARRALLDSRQRLRHLAQHDALTGVFNARAFAQHCNAHLLRATPTEDALVFVDLDHFKRINDQHGHDAGDAVLRAAAQCLQRNLRPTDVLGRVGGEEFCVFLPNTSEAPALALAERLRAALQALRPEVAPGVPLDITASLGVAVRPAQLGSLADIQRHADQAMYQAKAQGRNRVCRFAPPPAASA